MSPKSRAFSVDYLIYLTKTSGRFLSVCCKLAGLTAHTHGRRGAEVTNDVWQIKITHCYQTFVFISQKSLPLSYQPENQKVLHNTRAVRKVSVHFEYHENRSRGVDIIWQPVRGDLTAQT